AQCPLLPGVPRSLHHGDPRPGVQAVTHGACDAHESSTPTDRSRIDCIAQDDAKQESSNSIAAFAKRHMLASRSGWPVSIVMTRSTGPATAMHAWPAASP